MYPNQPLPFLLWLAGQIAPPPGPGVTALFEPGGVLSLRRPAAAGGGRLAWVPGLAGTGAGFAVKGLPGRFVAAGLEEAEARDLAAAVARVVAAHDPVFLAFGPGAGSPPAEFTPQGFGSLLGRHLQPGTTRWGPWRFEDLRQASPLDLDLSFRREAPGDGEPLVLRLSLAPRPGPGGARPASDLSLRRLQDPRSPADLRAPEHQVERLVGFSVGRALGAGLSLAVPRSPGDGGDPEPPDDEGQRPRTATLAELLDGIPYRYRLGPAVFFRSWGLNFVANEMVLKSPGLGRLVCHSNRECLCGTVPVTGLGARYHGMPWTRDREDPGDVIITDFDDRSAILGGGDRLEGALDRAVDAAGDRPVFVMEMCEYESIGDDVAGIVARCRERTGARVLAHDNVMAGSPLALLDNRWIPVLDLLLPPGADGGPPDPAAVNLCGHFLPGSAAHREVAPLLEAAGIRLQGVIFPYLDAATAPGLSRASLWALNPWQVTGKGLGAALARRGLRTVPLPVPCGVEGTRSFVQDLGAALGRPPADPGRLDALLEPFARRLALLREAARGHAVGLVVPGRHLDEVLSPAFFFGLDPVAFLQELGFGVVILVADGGRAVAGRVVDGPGGPRLDGRLPVVLRREGEDVQALVRRAPCQAVYTDYPGDPRVTGAGKAPFDVRALEPGPGGAVRTARRLLALCRGTLHGRLAGLAGGGRP